MSHEEIVDTLNVLIETAKDGEYGFRTSAEFLMAPEIRTLFVQRAGECRQAAAELQGLVQQHGGKPEDSGSTGGALHRGWVTVMGTLAGYSTVDILEEAEHGEDLAVDSYQRALSKSLPAGLRLVVEHQLEGVKRNHAQVRFLRDQARAASV